MKDRIAARVKTAAPGEWITGRGWDHTLWDVQQTPTRADIDAVTGDHPAIFNRVDGHIAIANSAALKAAGITSITPIRTAERSTKTIKASPPAFCAKPPWDWLARRFLRQRRATKKGC